MVKEIEPRMDTNEHEEFPDTDSTDFHGLNPCQSVESVSPVLIRVYSSSCVVKKQKTHRRIGSGFGQIRVNAQNPSAALVSSAFVSSRFKLQFMSEVYIGNCRGQV
jgi:hypothetical protein